MVENFDPNTIADAVVRQVVVSLMNQVENLHAKVQEQAEVIQHQRDEINRLKGEQGKPKITANKPARDQSSEKERRESKPHHKADKPPEIKINRVEVLKIEDARLPHDAQFKGYEEVIIQDIDIRTENIQFRKEKYYSASQRQTYLAELPSGYEGQFGPGVRAWVFALYYAGGMSEPKLLEFLQTLGMSISAGQLSDMLIKDQDQFHAERAAVVQAGRARSPWQHLDSTASRVNGQNEPCHVLCKPLYTAYCTLPAKDRLSMLRVLLGGADAVCRCNELALRLLHPLGVAEKWRKKLSELLPQAQEWQENQLDEWLDSHLPTLGPPLRKLIKDALAIAAYRPQAFWPGVALLICDDAPQGNWLTLELACGWLHEFRHYKKLTTHIPIHRQLVDSFNERFWQWYANSWPSGTIPISGTLTLCRLSSSTSLGSPLATTSWTSARG